MKLYSSRLLKEHFFKKRSEGKRNHGPKTEQEQTVTLLEKKTVTSLNICFYILCLDAK
jgi:hypothetical protein